VISQRLSVKIRRGSNLYASLRKSCWHC